ncbi:uncharacterized protein [Triticum aestivum]|uniref:uncharacterized protein isoform X2 n=1 Tax=Triticum aestivum TaxID=4565 RepID=UPI001D007A17|nr:uncharacterized protein LOC123093322 isoform X2 [Triticum aestivum]
MAPPPPTLFPKMSPSPARVSLKLGYIILYQVNLSNRTRMKMTEVGEPKRFSVVFKGVAGDVHLHQELAPGGGRPEREAVGAAGDLGHEQRAGGNHPQLADVEPAPMQCAGASSLSC